VKSTFMKFLGTRKGGQGAEWKAGKCPRAKKKRSNPPSNQQSQVKEGRGDRGRRAIEKGAPLGGKIPHQTNAKCGAREGESNEKSSKGKFHGRGRPPYSNMEANRHREKEDTLSNKSQALKKKKGHLRESLKNNCPIARGATFQKITKLNPRRDIPLLEEP